MRRSLGKSIKNTWSTVKRESIETPQDTLQRSLKTEKELGVPVQEGRDPLEGIRTMIDREVGETIARKAGETTTRIVGETLTETVEETTIMRQVGETTVLRGAVGEATARGRDKIEAETGVGETILLKRIGGTLVKIGEGIARGPLVMEGPQQANP